MVDCRPSVCLIYVIFERISHIHHIFISFRGNSFAKFALLRLFFTNHRLITTFFLLNSGVSIWQSLNIVKRFSDKSRFSWGGLFYHNYGFGSLHFVCHMKNHFSHKGLFGSQTKCFMANWEWQCEMFLQSQGSQGVHETPLLSLMFFVK